MCYRAPIQYVMPFILVNGLQILVEAPVLTRDSQQIQYTFKSVGEWNPCAITSGFQKQLEHLIFILAFPSKLGGQNR